MKKIVCLILFLMLIMVVFIPAQTRAFSTGFDVSEISLSEKANIVKNMDFKYLTNEPKKVTIDCFDVNQKYMIAIGGKKSSTGIVCVYSLEGLFQYGYSFKCNGTFLLEWGDDLNIYLANGYLISVDANGAIKEIVVANNTYENSIYAYSLEERIKNVAGKTFTATNKHKIFNNFASTYTQLIVEDDSGQQIIYDVSNDKILKDITIVIIAIIVFVMSLFGGLNEMKKRKLRHN